MQEVKEKTQQDSNSRQSSDVRDGKSFVGEAKDAEYAKESAKESSVRKEPEIERPLEKAPDGERKETEKDEGQEKGKLAQAQAEIEKLRESWSRERAEFMNYRKRVAQERQKQVTDTVVSFLQELLPVFDNLDQVVAMEAQSEEVKKYVEGISMIRENFIQVLSNRNIKALRPVNEEFDPQSMEAIATEEDAKFSKDTVLEVYQAGYLMQGEEGEENLVRPARVRVAKAQS